LLLVVGRVGRVVALLLLSGRLPGQCGRGRAGRVSRLV